MKTHCYSVRLESLISISDKCFLAKAFDGSEALIPKSMVFGQDSSVNKSEAYWISSWILKQKSIQYSTKKEAWFNENGKQLPNYNMKVNVPEPINKEVKHDESLFK